MPRDLRKTLRDSPRRPPADPYDSLKNIHLDVHGLRRDIRNAIEKSQTALMNRLSLIEAKIDKIGTGGATPEDAAALAALATEGEAIAVRLEVLNAKN